MVERPCCQQIPIFEARLVKILWLRQLEIAQSAADPLQYFLDSVQCLRKSNFAIVELTQEISSTIFA